jgi:alpha-galactosidase
MASAMLAAQAEWLPQFAGKSIRPTPTISIPSNVQPAHVPVDPALAIIARFQELSR